MSEALSPAPERMNTDRIYFGWRVVAAMMLTTASVYGALLFGFIVLGVPMAQQFGWSAAETGSLVSAMWVVAPLALFVAPIIQKLGALRTIVIGLVLQAICFSLLGTIESFWQLYALRIVMGMGKVVTVVSVPVMITTWFSKRFGTAMALGWCGGALGGFIYSPLTEYLLTIFKWQQVAIILAGCLLGTIALLLLLCRGASVPADLGLARDGLPLGSNVNDQDQAEEKGSASELWSINKATAGLMFCGLMLAGLAGMAMQTEAYPLMLSSGMSASHAATLLGLLSVSAMLGQILTGWLLDRWSVERCTALIATLLSVGLSTFSVLQSSPTFPLGLLAAVIFGLGLGGIEMKWITLVKVQFGSRLFAYTYGGWSFAIAVGYALGGTAGGWLFDHYSHALFSLFVLTLYAPAIVIAVWRPAKRNVEP
jgi:MFS family permease